ncbi:MAG: peptidoglycan-binding domain-containing protein [Wenzhouxiangella sp.]
MLGIVAVIGVLWLIGEADKIPSSPAPSYSPPARSTTPSYSAAPAQPQFPTRLDETKPPVGQDLVFSTSQIRYCLAEDIRMEAARAVLNNYSDSDVDRFNAMVADYNSRCGSFRYRSGVLESARRDVEPYRSQLQAEGRSRFARSPSTGAPATPAPARPTPDETVRAVQQRLNELGYNPGPADGLMGPRTRAAIISFQQAQGLAATGLAEQAVLSQMQQAAPRTQSTWVEPLSPPSSPERPPHQSTSGGKPDLSEISASERAAIENACGYHQRNSGPGEYYNCLRRQLTVLASSGGRPDLSRASSSEQAAIERACGYHQRNSGPGEYYNCLRRQLTVLASSGGRPDLSRASSSEQAAIERACGYHQRNSGPGDYYRCLRSEMAKLGYR